MSVDLSQFHQVFFEESFEGLDSMESALMELDPSAVDAETINTIFRAAHSIKGGSATFGFSIVADFTHVLETLLDEIRSDARPIRQDDIDLFLQSVDCLRDLLSALQNDETPDAEQSVSLGKAFEDILAQDPQTPSYLAGTTESSQSDTPAVEKKGSSVSDLGDDGDETDGPWRIRFIPGRDILRTGNEPLRILRELEELGRTCVTPIVDHVPDYSVLDPEACYLGFDIVFRDRIERLKLDEVFEWVIDESDLEIVLACHSPGADDSGTDGSNVASLEDSSWSVSFKPGEDVLRTGNEPLRIFRELTDAGLRRVSAQVESLPSWSLLNPESCYLAWQLSIEDHCDEAQIHEAFEWVVDESDIAVTRIDTLSSEVVSETIETEPRAKQSDIEGSTKSVDVSSEAVRNSAVQASASDSDSITQTPGVSETSGQSVAQIKDAPKSPVVKKASASESTSIRVGIDKVDTLINMVGELVITQSMLGELGNDFDIDCLPKLREGLSQLEQNTRELQESVMRIRMLPISFAFSRFPRMVRDLGKRLNKKIHLELIGEQTELDKTVMEKIGDPLVHLVRNAIDHGIEQPEERVDAGKTDTGTITLNAYHQGGNVVIEITDDGKGLDRSRIVDKALDSGLIQEKDAQFLSDEQVYDMIFQPGFSTAQEVSDVSGRGVGMDVVRRNIQALNGSVEINSTAGKGSKITIRLPLTLAILDGQLVRVGDQTYIFPLVSIVESLQSKDEKISRVAGGCDVFQLRDEYVPIIQLHEIFNVEADTNSLDDALMVVVEYDGEKVGVVVDDLQAQQQVVIKSLEQNYQRVEGISGATILGDGTVALILDIPGLVKLAGITHQQQIQLVSPSGSTPTLKSIA